jgi:spore maturation protein CgeB
MKGRRVSSEECVKIFNATTINLNLHSSVQKEQLVTGGDFINPRTFELCSCGAFQLVDKRTLMDEAFAQGELATFTSMDEMLSMIDLYLNNPEKRQMIAERGQKRVLKDHTYTVRMQTLIDFTAERIPGWPAQKEKRDLFPTDFPEELKRDINALIHTLNLPEDVGFEDLVWAIRQQQGTLSDLETAVLFLDEWQKLYKKK